MSGIKNVLEIKDLKKAYKDQIALDGISLNLKEGEIVGLLGPNGAGKTTTIQMLLGLTRPDSGSIFYFGRDFSKNQEYCLSRINFTSAYSQVQGKLTVEQNMRIYAGLYGVTTDFYKKIDGLLDMFGILHLKKKIFWQLSSGQRTRVNLVKMMLNSPKVLLMDEPTASLDPEIVDKVLKLVLKLQKQEGMAILYTSHNMNEIERICDRVIFLDKGKIVAEDTPLGLTKIVGQVVLTLTFDGEQKPLSTYFNEKELKHLFPRKHVVELRIKEDLVPKTLFGLSKRGVWITNIDIKKPNLEDVFLTVAKGEYYEPAKS